MSRPEEDEAAASTEERFEIRTRILRREGGVARAAIAYLIHSATVTTGAGIKPSLAPPYGDGLRRGLE